MIIILWKKAKEMKKIPIKIIFALLIPCILLFLYRLLNIEVNVMFRLLPLITTCFSTYILFNVDEITYSSWYIIFGLKMRNIWLADILFKLIFGFILTEIVLIFYYFIFKPNILINSLFVNLSTFIIAFFLLGVSTVHYSSNSKRAMIISSIFSVVNLLLLGLPLLYIFIPGNFFESIYPYVLTISVILTVIIYIYMNIDRRELLVRNTQGYLGGYDANFFGED